MRTSPKLTRKKKYVQIGTANKLKGQIMSKREREIERWLQSCCLKVSDDSES